MYMSEQEALKRTEQTKRIVNRFNFNKKVNPLLYGVAFDDNQKTIASEFIHAFFHDNGAGHCVNGILLKSMYRKNSDGTETKIRAWLEENGRELTLMDMANLIYRI